MKCHRIRKQKMPLSDSSEKDRNNSYELIAIPRRDLQIFRLCRLSLEYDMYCALHSFIIISHFFRLVKGFFEFFTKNPLCTKTEGIRFGNYFFFFLLSFLGLELFWLPDFFSVSRFADSSFSGSAFSSPASSDFSSASASSFSAFSA